MNLVTTVSIKDSVNLITDVNVRVLTFVNIVTLVVVNVVTIFYIRVNLITTVSSVNLITDVKVRVLTAMKRSHERQQVFQCVTSVNSLGCMNDDHNRNLMYKAQITGVPACPASTE